MGIRLKAMKLTLLTIILGLWGTSVVFAAQDAGLVSQLTGEVTCFSAEAGADLGQVTSFMKLREGDKLRLSPNSSLKLVYFTGGRQETWKGPAILHIGLAESKPEAGEGLSSAPEVKNLPLGVAKALQNSPMAVQSGNFEKGGFVQVRSFKPKAKLEFSQPPLDEASQAKLESAKRAYQNLAVEEAPGDATAELYYAGVLAELNQLADLEQFLSKAISANPGNPALLDLRQWLEAKAEQAKQ